MLVPFRTELPEDHRAARQAIYDGDVFMLEPTDASQALVRHVLTTMRAELGTDALRKVQFDLDPRAFFERMGVLRKTFYASPETIELTWAILRDCGFNDRDNAFDPMRLRIVADGACDDPAAAPVYYGHRDTWYAHSQALITWWVPLHDLRPEETFHFFLDRFNRAVHNDSEIFHYESWLERDRTRKVGWQNPKAGREAQYPRLLEDLGADERWGFGCRAGQIMLFSGSHLHQTRPNRTGQTRFSMDWRTVHLGDHEHGVGAPNVDNRSTGSAMSQYVFPDDIAAPASP